MNLLDRLRRKKTVDLDARRRQLLITGRITDGVILDIETNSDGDEVATYLYTLNGVDFESAELLTMQQRSERAKYAPGARIGVRYDPRNQGNSIIE